MKELTLHTCICIYSLEELNEDDRQLMRAAHQAALTAYAPYSHFQVGAALRLDDGKIVTGSNQENIAYPSGLCAERVALFTAGAQHPNQAVNTLAIAACKGGQLLTSPVTPCGACRQVMIETMQRSQHPLRVLLCGDHTVYEIKDAAHLLPLAFGLDKILES